MFYLAVSLIIVSSFMLGATSVFFFLNRRKSNLNKKYFRELEENYYLELQNRWLRESMERFQIL